MTERDESKGTPGSPPGVPEARQPDPADELARLRDENERLRAMLATAPIEGEPPVARSPRQWWRAVVATICIALAIVLAPLSVVAVWADDQVGSTDRYVETVAPLATDPAVQNAVINRITREIFAYIDLDEITDQLVTTLSAQGLPPRAATALEGLKVPIVNGVRNFVRERVSRIVHSQTFQDAWVDANRVAHDQLVAVLSGETSETVQVVGQNVTVNLSAFIETIKQALVANGFNLAANIPTVNATFTVLQSSDLENAQGAYALLDKIGTWLPWIALLLLAVGVYVARGHRRALLIGALGVAASMLVLGIGIAIGRAIYLDALPPTSDQNAAGVIFDTLVRFLRTSLRTVLLLFLVVAVGAFVTGPTVTAVRLRSGLTRAFGAARGGAEHVGFDTGPVGAWLYRNKVILRFVFVAVVALWYVFLERPTTTNVVWLAVLLLVLLALLEFLARPPRAAPAEPVSDDTVPVA